MRVPGDLVTRTTAIRDLGQMAFNMTYRAFIAALDLEDDDYARDKYTDLKALARAMAPFTDATLARLTEAYAAPRSALCEHGVNKTYIDCTACVAPAKL